MKPFLRYYSACIDRNAEELSYRGTVSNACVCVASAVNVLSGGEALENLYVDIVSGAYLEPHDPVQDQKDAQEIKSRIMNKVNALSK